MVSAHNGEIYKLRGMRVLSVKLQTKLACILASTFIHNIVDNTIINTILLFSYTATDAKERQHWINLVRAVAEYHGQTSLKPTRPPPPKESSLLRSATVSSTSLNSNKSPLLHKSHSMKLPSALKLGSPRNRQTQQQQAQPPAALTNPIQEELKNIKDALNSVVEYQSSAVESLEVFYFAINILIF